MKDPLDSLVFIRLNKKPDILGSFQDFNPDIPLPVRLPPEEAKPGKQEGQSRTLSTEAVLAGILTVFAWDTENPDKDYYKKLLLKIRPDLRRELTEAALIKIRNKDFDLAEEIFLALKGINPGDRETTLNIALLSEEKAEKSASEGNKEKEDFYIQEAERYYREAMEADPPLPEAFFNAGYFFLNRHEYKKAAEAFQTYCTLETGTDETSLIRKEKAEAITAGIRSKNLDDSLFKAAYDLINKGEEERAIEDIRLFLERRPKVWNAWFMLGWALRRLERWEDAKNSFLRALELREETEDSSGGRDEPGEGLADICNEIAICTLEAGLYEESRRWLMTGLEADPENVKIISNLGVVAWKTGNRQEAEGFFRTALEISPEDKTALLLLRQMESS